MFYDSECSHIYFDPVKEIDNITNQIKDYFVKNGPNSKAVIGISGGKDSTVAAALLVRALGKDKVVGILMPDGKQTDIDDSYEVCKMFDIEYHTINIASAMSGLLNEYHLHVNDTILTNTPARIRMTILYMVAASVGGRVINTCNFSEDYVGYSTKYGDLAGDFSVLKNYTVREVIAIGDALGLPPALVHKVPSDGMCGRSDEDNLGFSYKVLDEFLLENIVPEYSIYEEIEKRHNRNKHKECIQIPAVSPNRILSVPGYRHFQNLYY